MVSLRGGGHVKRGEVWWAKLDSEWPIVGALTLVETEAGRTISRMSADEIAARGIV